MYVKVYLKTIWYILCLFTKPGMDMSTITHSCVSQGCRMVYF
jgi:hypothetical protein